MGYGATYTINYGYPIIQNSDRIGHYHFGCMGLAAGVHEILIRTGSPASVSFFPFPL